MTTPDPSLSDRLAEASAARASKAGRRFRARQEYLEAAARRLYEAACRLYEAGDVQGYKLTADHAHTAACAASAALESAAALEVCAQELRTLEAEVARLHRQNAQLTEEVHDLLARLQEAHNDADRLAVAVLVASGDMDAAEVLGPHPTAAEVDAAVDRAAVRILNEWGPWRPAGGAR